MTARQTNRRRRSPAAIILLGFGFMIACAPMTRYRILSFFLDGVPNPEAPPAPTTRPKPPIQQWLPEGYALPKPIAVPTALPVVSDHAPYAQHQCLKCHEMKTDFKPMAVDARLCDQCHLEERIREGWDHGPINLGTCIPCHRAHDSPYPHLLEKPVPDLCQDCHAEDLKRNPDYHQVPNLNDCTACHDPHRMY